MAQDKTLLTARCFGFAVRGARFPAGGGAATAPTARAALGADLRAEASSNADRAAEMMQPLLAYGVVACSL